MRAMLGLVASSVVLAGCGPSAPVPVAVSGAVTFDGAPLEAGVVYFYPADGGPPDGGPFQGGKYELTAVPGKKRVEFRAFRKRPGAGVVMEASGTPDAEENFVPAQYNSESKLTAEVSPAGPNVFDFSLRSK